MAPQKTWRAWFVDSNGRRTERSGTGEMPADVREQLRRTNDNSNDSTRDGGNDAVDGAGVGVPTADAQPTSAATTPAAVTSAASATATPVTAPTPPPAPVTVPVAESVPVAKPVPSNTVANPTHASAAGLAASASPQASTNAAAKGNPAMVALGFGLIAALAVLVVAGLLMYRRRLNRRDRAVAAALSEREAQHAADMFLDFNDKPTTAASSSTVTSSSSGGLRSMLASATGSIKGRRIGEPTLVNTTATEALRGPGVIAAGPLQPKTSTKKQKPKLSLAMYRTTPAGVGGPTIISPAMVSPRSARNVPSGLPTDSMGSISLASPHYAMLAPSPRRLTSFDCAPSPLPVDGRQRVARYDYADSLTSPQTPQRQLVGHRRSVSRGSVNARVAAYNPNARQAFYGQNGLNRLSAASGASAGNDSFLSIPVSSRFSFDRERLASSEARDVHGLI